MSAAAPTAATEALPDVLRRLRHAGRFDAAGALLAQVSQQHADEPLRHLAWQHEPFWWQPLVGRRARLARRGPDDAAFVRRCWNDAAFMLRFNRLAVALPGDDDALRAMLARERAALIADSRSLHWTIHGPDGPAGFASLVEIGLLHRRAEFLIGVLPGAGAWLPTEAAHLVMKFAADTLKLERLSAYVYPENDGALRIAEKFGFEREGLLRGWLRLPGAAQRSDLVVAGLLLDDAFFARTAPMRRRLLGR